MNIKLERLFIQTKKTREIIEFSELITYVYGPVGKGKSTLARLIDFCF
jgi:replication-associated recombination protein RarA